MIPERTGKRVHLVHVAVVRWWGVQLVSGLFCVVSLCTHLLLWNCNLYANWLWHFFSCDQTTKVYLCLMWRVRWHFLSLHYFSFSFPLACPLAGPFSLSTGCQWHCHGNQHLQFMRASCSIVTLTKWSPRLVNAVTLVIQTRYLKYCYGKVRTNSLEWVTRVSRKGIWILFSSQIRWSMRSTIRSVYRHMDFKPDCHSGAVPELKSTAKTGVKLEKN